MSTTKGKLLRIFSRVALQRAHVAAVHRIGGFGRLRLDGEPPSFEAGAKVQVLLASDDTRTYTPVATPEGLVLLGWLSAGGPGARWFATVREGDELLYLGPQRSLSLPDGPVVIVGDETSVAVAAAFNADRPGRVHTVLQVGDADGVRAAAASIGLDRLELLPRGDHAATAAAVRAYLGPAPSVALTGGAAMVGAVRGLLRDAGTADVKVKTYWVPGRTGID